MELGKKIRQLRFKAGLTQEQLAEQLGVGAQAVSKWETGVAMPDITTLPLLAEIFGSSIDDLFDLSLDQRLNRIENRMDVEEELSQDLFREYEDFLKSQLDAPQYRERATDLIAYLYWHRMNSYAKQVSRYAREAVRLSPGKKGCQWMLQMAEGHAAWDWNIHNHTAAIDFYRRLADEHPDLLMPHLYLLDNLIADHRVTEAEAVLAKLPMLGEKPALTEVYRAHIALARFNEPEADRIMEKLLDNSPQDFAVLFEAAQYYAMKCDYEKAIALYERSFEAETRRPRFTDELYGIADIYRIMGNTQKAAETYDRIIDLLEHEWGFTEETELKQVKEKKARLFSK